MADWQATGGPRHYRSPMLAGLPEVTHGFFTRQGGVCAGALSQSECELDGGGWPGEGGRNLGRMQQALGLTRLAGAAQAHGGRAAVVTSPDLASPEGCQRRTSWSPPSPAWACSSSRRTVRR